MQRAAAWRKRFNGALSRGLIGGRGWSRGRDFGALRDYAKLLSGSAGRLVLSLAYFVSVANSLSVADFGLFATASASGIVLSRIAGFGFVSPLYRIATRKPELVGVYTANLLAAFGLSLPVVTAAAAGFFLAFFSQDMTVATFAAIVAAEVVCWRGLEVVCVVNNGLGRFGRAAAAVIAGSALRALAAVLFAAALPTHSLAAWSLVYLAVNALAFAGAAAFFYPRRRLRLVPALALARAPDSFWVAGAEILFYLQSELDKFLVLSLGGARMAGLYAILMRLVDLTALPVRSFNTMVVQKLMKAPQWLGSWRVRWTIEGGIAAVSVGGLAGLGGFLYVFPNALGANVADVGPLVLLALLVPAFRNLVEYQSELLYARGRTGARALILASVGVIKAGLLSMLLVGSAAGETWLVGLNGVFFALWAASATATYTALEGAGVKLRAVSLRSRLAS